MLGFPKSPDRRLTWCATGQEDGARLPAPRGSLRFGAAVSKGRRHRASRSRRTSGRIERPGLPAVHRRHHRRLARAPRCTHRNVVANVLQSEAWIPAGDRQPGQDSPLDEPADHRLRAAALSHLRADREHAACSAMRTGGVNILIPNPRDMPSARHQGTACRTEVQQLPGRQHAVQRCWSNSRRSSTGRLLGASSSSRSAAAWRCRSVAEKLWLRTVTGCAICRGYGLSETSPTPPAIRPIPTSLHRHYRPADAVHRHQADPRRRRRRGAARPARRDRDQGPAGDGRLLAAARTRPRRS